MSTRNVAPRTTIPCTPGLAARSVRPGSAFAVVGAARRRGPLGLVVALGDPVLLGQPLAEIDGLAAERAERERVDAALGVDDLAAHRGLAADRARTDVTGLARGPHPRHLLLALQAVVR